MYQTVINFLRFMRKTGGFLPLYRGLTIIVVTFGWLSNAAASEPIRIEENLTILRDVVDPRPRRSQVLGLTGGARPATGPVIQAAPPQTAIWNVYDHATFTDYAVNFSLRYTSTYAYFYVDQAETVSQPALEAVGATLDANYATIKTDFGDVPNVDGEARVFVLLTDIRDEYTYNAGATSYVPCFFDPLHEHPAQSGSNGREILYLDLNPTVPDSDRAGRCLAHQLALMTAYNYDPSEEFWADAGMATLAEFIAGYGHRPEVEDFLQDPNQPLTGWTGSKEDIGQSYLWSLYIRERFGQSGARQLFQSPLSGLAAIAPVLGISESILFQQWNVANYLEDEIQAGGIYSYSDLDIVSVGANQVDSFTRPPLHATVSLAEDEEKVITGTLAGYYAGRYIAIERSGGSDLQIKDVSPSYGQSTLINRQANHVDWSKQMTQTIFVPGDVAVLAIGLSRDTGSMEYRYTLDHIPTSGVIYYLPLIFRN